MKVTLGPRGRNVLLNKSYGAPRITKDGVTVAKEIELADRFENMGAQMIKDVRPLRQFPFRDRDRPLRDRDRGSNPLPPPLCSLEPRCHEFRPRDWRSQFA